ncbi:endonuclease G [Zhouia amylolytica]|uniref:Endonuclease n=2 Tax=Zhouia amylolytica TaxID=376730 RepID=A0A1I6P0W9_9FLAO|nr:endonuclease G [Zhouia amylolytica]
MYRVLLALVMIGFFLFEKYYDANASAVSEKNSNNEFIIDSGDISSPESFRDFLPSTTTNTIIHHNFYSLSYNEDHEQSEWVAYELKKEHLTNDDRKRPYFEMDSEVGTGSAHWQNFKNSGYDRGHLCPAGDRRFSIAAYEETFLTSNISPQNHQFNSGVWNRLEQQVRYWAEKHGNLLVITGAVLTDGLATIGSEKVSVPEQFYKIVFKQSDVGYEVITFLIPHEASEAPLDTFIVPVDTLESLTGIDFFYRLKDEVEFKLESELKKQPWFD